MIITLKNGSGIHIKKKNRGKFTSYCGGKVTDECIRRAKSSGNPTLVKRATFADNARHFKHKDGGILKAQLGLKTKNVDLTPVDLLTFYKNYKLYGNNRFIDTLILRNIDNELISYNVGLPQRLAIIYTTLLEGNKTGSHGNGAFGLIGWRGTRASNLPQSTKGQATKIYDETYGKFNGTNWNHGGIGSGYNSAKDAYDTFKNAKDVRTATHAFNYGYVRPPKEDSLYRTNNVSRLFGYQQGGIIPDLSTFILESSTPLLFNNYTKNGNSFLILKLMLDQEARQRELLLLSEDSERLLKLGETWLTKLLKKSYENNQELNNSF